MSVDNGRPSKRRKVTPPDLEEHDEDIGDGLASTWKEPERPISPPRLTRGPVRNASEQTAAQISRQPPQAYPQADASRVDSPISLTWVQDLSERDNKDCVTLRDILGDPLIKETWQFNYLFDVDFLMSAFDEDVRHLVQIKIVHGHWRREDASRQRLEQAASQNPNVQIVTAYMPEMFGTHHSKMMILFRHDDTAQVVIHTANMIIRDWRNMSQAVWLSPILPLLPESPNSQETSSQTIGSGQRFKSDLLRYLSAYGKSRLGELTDKLQLYDFSQVRAAFIGSTPSKVSVESSKPLQETRFGWPGLKDILSSIPSAEPDKKPVIVTQVSSIASLGQSDKWLVDFQSVLASSSTESSHRPRFRVVFPTPDEIRKSLDGYESGASIHTKIQSPAQQKQLEYLRPFLCHWGGSNHQSDTGDIRQAGRQRAAPHIKTYIRFASDSMDKIDWGMVTSANLSTQAWGAGVNKDGEVRICSYEVGVVFWPALFDTNGRGEPPSNAEKATMSASIAKAIMTPTFRSNTPSIEGLEEQTPSTVGFRMPYDLPLVPYSHGEVPWCATLNHSEPDWKGGVWQARG